MIHLLKFNEKFERKNIIRDLEDICQELKDERYSIGVTSYKGAVHVQILAKNFGVYQPGTIITGFTLQDVSETVERMIDYMKSNGFAYKITDFSPTMDRKLITLNVIFTPRLV